MKLKKLLFINHQIYLGYPHAIETPSHTICGARKTVAAQVHPLTSDVPGQNVESLAVMEGWNGTGGHLCCTVYCFLCIVLLCICCIVLYSPAIVSIIRCSRYILGPSNYPLQLVQKNPNMMGISPRSYGHLEGLRLYLHISWTCKKHTSINERKSLLGFLCCSIHWGLL